MQNVTKLVGIVGLLLLLSGCANYEYDVLRPQDAGGHVGKKTDLVVKLDPLEYRLRTVDSRLVMQIYNPTNDNIALLGDRSNVVAPDGQSHPLRSQSIAPNSYGKLIFPPMRPEVYHTGPSIGFGIGTVVGSRDNCRGSTIVHPFATSPAYGGPQYLRVIDENDNLYWDWNGEGEIRIRLFYDRNDKNFADELVIARRKM